MDNRIIHTDGFDKSILKKNGLQWFGKGDNVNYISSQCVKVTSLEIQDFIYNSEDMYKLGLKAAKHVIENDRWADLHIPKNCRKLIKYSFEKELGNHLISRMDFTGGIDNQPMKFLEFNADTCTLIPEAEIIQKEYYKQNKKNLYQEPYCKLYDDLVAKLRSLLTKYPRKEKTLLISTLGNEEDWLNTDIIAKAAKQAGFEDVQSMPLDKITFSHEEGIFIEVNDDEFLKFDFWFKLVPWEFIAYEEPRLLEILEKIILNDLAVIMNPIWTMLLQSKGIGIIMKEVEPNNPLLLKTILKPDFTEPYFGKPVFGRIGENIKLFTSASEVIYETEGDHGNYPLVYQEAARLNIDKDGHRYQPSMFWVDNPSGFCLRRQDDPIIDDDTEFIAHTIF